MYAPSGPQPAYVTVCGPSSLTSPSSFSSPLGRDSLSGTLSTPIASPLLVLLDPLATLLRTDAEADTDVSSLALESRRLFALALVDRRSGLLSSRTSAWGSGVGTSDTGITDSVAEPSSATRFAAPLGIRVARFAGYVASPSSASFLFLLEPPPARLFRGLALSFTSRETTGAMAGGGGISSSPSRSLAAGRRARAEERREESKSPIVTGEGSPNIDGSRGGRETARRPRGWYNGRGGVMGYFFRGIATEVFDATMEPDVEATSPDKRDLWGTGLNDVRESALYGDWYVNWGLRRIEDATAIWLPGPSGGFW